MQGRQSISQRPINCCHVVGPQQVWCCVEFEHRLQRNGHVAKRRKTFCWVLTCILWVGLFDKQQTVRFFLFPFFLLSSFSSSVLLILFIIIAPQLRSTFKTLTQPHSISTGLCIWNLELFDTIVTNRRRSRCSAEATLAACVCWAAQSVRLRRI